MRKNIILITVMTLLCFLVNSASTLAASLIEDRSKITILTYHRIGEDHYPQTSLRKDDFIEHIKELQTGDYNILSLSTALNKVQNKEIIPPKTVVITFEGAYKSAFLNGMKLLLQKEIPFTIFYSSDKADENIEEYMSWKDLKSIAKNKFVTIGTLPASYSRLISEDTITITKSLNKARSRYRENFGKEAEFLAYPFGEFSDELKELARTRGYKAAFGLHSGPYYHGYDPFAIPRFSLTQEFGDIERLRLISDTLPLPITEIVPGSAIIKQKLELGFTLPEALNSESENINCFLSGYSKPLTEVLGRRVEIRSNEEIESERMRLNCTLPKTIQDPDDPKNITTQWRWLGLLFYKG